MEGCVIQRDTVDFYGEATCRLTLYMGGEDVEDWRLLSEDCVYTDGDWYAVQYTYDDYGCRVHMTGAEVLDGERWEGVAEATCDALGGYMTYTLASVYTDDDGTVEEWGSSASFQNRYDTSSRMVTRDSDTHDDWGTSLEWETWEYVGDRLARYTSDYLPDAIYWSWISRIDYSYDAKGRLEAERWLRSTSEGDEAWTAHAFTYDDLDRVVLESEDELEDGVIDDLTATTWVGETRWVSTQSWDTNADGTAEWTSTYTYDCP